MREVLEVLEVLSHRGTVSRVGWGLLGLDDVHCDGNEVALAMLQRGVLAWTASGTPARTRRHPAHPAVRRAQSHARGRGGPPEPQAGPRREGRRGLTPPATLQGGAKPRGRVGTG